MRLAVLALLLILGVCTEYHSKSFHPMRLLRLRSMPPPRLAPNEARAIIRAAALKHKVSAAFVKSIMAAESDFCPGVVSDKGAIGLMQLMPETAQQFGVDPNIPAQNVDGGARYLKALITRYHKSRNWLPRVIAAYNAGPGVVDRYHGVPPYRETRDYVERVTRLCACNGPEF